MLKRAFIIVGVVVGLAVIYTTGSEQRSSDAEGGAPGEQVACTVTVTADVLNVRAGPGTDHDVVDEVRTGTEIDATTQVRDGFRKIGEDEWASDDYLEPVGGADCD